MKVCSYESSASASHETSGTKVEIENKSYEHGKT